MSNNEFRVEDIFLVYANRLFKDDPNNLKSITAAIKDFEMQNLDNIGIDYLKRQEENVFPAESLNILPTDLDPIVGEILRLSELGESGADFAHVMEKHGQANEYFPLNWHNIAYAAAYRYNDVDPNGKRTPCEYCLYFDERQELPFMTEPRKCFECDQLEFVAMLDKLIEGQELDELPEFRFYLQARNRAVTNIIDFDIAKDNSFKKR